MLALTLCYPKYQAEFKPAKEIPGYLFGDKSGNYLHSAQSLIKNYYQPQQMHWRYAQTNGQMTHPTKLFTESTNEEHQLKWVSANTQSNYTGFSTQNPYQMTG